MRWRVVIACVAGLSLLAVVGYQLQYDAPDNGEPALPGGSTVGDKQIDAEWRLNGYSGSNLEAISPGAVVRVYALAATPPYLQYSAITGPVFIRRAIPVSAGGIDILLDMDPRTRDIVKRASAAYPLAIGDDAQTFWAAPPEIASAVLSGQLMIAPAVDQDASRHSTGRSSGWSGSGFDCPGPGCPSVVLE